VKIWKDSMVVCFKAPSSGISGTTG